jgi:hypothetical protein
MAIEEVEESVQPDMHPTTIKLSINAPYDQGIWMRKLAFDMRISESSIISIALGILQEQGDAVEEILRSRGAWLRRSWKSEVE